MQEAIQARAEALRATLMAVADPERARAMAAYMRDRFVFFGITTPLRRALCMPTLKTLAKTIDVTQCVALAEVLWAMAERECQYVAADLLILVAGGLEASSEPQLAAMVRACAWWDSVDPLATRVYGMLLQRHPELSEHVERYAQHDDLWLRRVAILHSLYYSERTDTARLTRILDRNLSHPDFFVRKAMGWALRQYARTDALWVKRYLAERGDEVPALTRREALRRLQD